MDEISEEIYRAAVENDAYSPEQVVRVLRSSITDRTKIGEIVRNMKADADTYGGLFRAHCPLTLKAKPL
jgi:hypothetical protein